jgi:chromosome partitioning protein
MRRIAIAGVNGGTGKTTTAVTLAHALALAGRRVLLVDCDPRRHAALHFGLAPDGGLAAWLCGARSRAVEVRRGLRVLDSGGQALAGVQLRLARPNAPDKLRNYLASVHDVDYLLLDCSPASGPQQSVFLLAADEIVMPVAPDFLGFTTATAALDDIARLRTHDGKVPRLLGVLATFHDPNSATASEVDAVLEACFSGRMLRSRVRRSEALRVAPAKHGTVFDIDPLSDGAQDYALLAEEIERGAA